MNVIFIDFLTKDGYNFSIKENFNDIVMNGVMIMHEQLKDGIYVLS